MEKNKDPGWFMNRSLINLLTVVVGLVAAYFVTIQSIKLEMAAKAEGGVVETLDKKLTNFEVILKETVVSKEQFYQFSREIEARLGAIEFYMMEQSGDKIGKN